MAEKRALFETAEDINLKLSQCVILKKDTPIYVKQYAGGNNLNNFRIFYTELPLFKRMRDWEEMFVSDSALDWKNLGTRLGYMNAGRHGNQREALFIQRTPARKTHQGLHNQNTKISPWTFDERWGFNGGNSLLDHHIKEDYFVDMMNGQYPSIQDCLKVFREFPKTASRAFHRFFAIRRPVVGPFYLQYKGQDVAWADDPEYRWKLGKEFDYLRETMEYNKIAV